MVSLFEYLQHKFFRVYDASTLRPLSNAEEKRLANLKRVVSLFAASLLLASCASSMSRASWFEAFCSERKATCVSMKILKVRF